MKMMYYTSAIFIVVNLALISEGYGQAGNLPTADEVLQKASEVANIPGLNVSALPVEEVRSALKKKCQDNGGETAYSDSEAAGKNMESCVRGLVNVTKLQEEIEAAKPNGELDTVFRQYCNKSPILKDCVANFTNTVQNCFTPKERENIRLVQNITDSLLNFVCFKEGDRIALFIGAGGPECIASKQSAIQDCLNSTFGGYVPSEGLTPSTAGLNNLPLLLLDTKECSDIERLQRCVVTELETCTDPTPGNIVDALFNFVKKVTPCENLLAKARADAITVRSGSSAIFGAQILTLVLAALARHV